MNSKVVTTIVIAAIILLGGWWFLARANGNTTIPTPNSASSNENSNSSNATNQSTPVAATITYTDNGFEPKQTTVKSGATVRIANNTQNPMALDSDPHPTHTTQPELNIGDVEPGQSKTFVVDKAGTWGFHNHNNPTDTGSITVQ